ncbi:MAG: GIY-YIG nuclease family protein [Ruminococcus sp.]|nr:GIY-YIG nuclease family protein [Ruminococcus sp.]
MDEYYKIYKYTNSLNGKVYIGQTKNSLARRADNGRGYDRCPAFYNAIQKYGFDNFTVEILADNLTLEKANELEEYYIAQYDSTNREKGYNLRVGGNNSEALNKKAVICIETSKIYSSIAEAEEDTGINYRMISECCNHSRGYKSAGGYHWSFYDRDTGEYEIIYVKKVLCIENNTVYKSCAEAARKLGISNGGCVSKVCRGTAKSIHGLHFKYVYEEVKGDG